MRRSIVPLSLLIAAVGIGSLLLTGAAGATQRAPRIICPLSQPHIVPTCCPLPPAADATSQAVCCQASQCCPAGSATPCCATAPCPSHSLTIASSPNPSTAGRKVVISGQVTGTPVSGTQIALWRKLPGQSSFHQIASTTTDSTGRYTFSFGSGTVMTDQSWYVTASRVQSAILHEQVAARIGLSAASHSTTVGRAVTLRGEVTPSHAGETVLIEQRRGGAWWVIARPRLGHGSSYTVSHRFAQPGPAKVRVLFRGDARNVKSISPTVTVTVEP